MPREKLEELLSPKVAETAADEAALNYLRLWKSSRSAWKFSKVNIRSGYDISCDTVTLTLRHRLCDSAAMTQTPWHWRYDADTVTLALWLRHCDTDTVTQTLWHCHCDADTVTLALWHWHCDADIVTLSLWRRHCDTDIVTCLMTLMDIATAASDMAATEHVRLAEGGWQTLWVTTGVHSASERWDTLTAACTYSTYSTYCLYISLPTFPGRSGVRADEEGS